MRPLARLLERRKPIRELCERAHLALPPDLRAMDIDAIASYSDRQIDAAGHQYGSSVIILIQVVVALWPLVKLLIELFGED
jgi:hypothetical protein